MSPLVVLLEASEGSNPSPRILARVGGWSYWFSGFCFTRVKWAIRESSGLTVQCLFFRLCIYGLNRRSFWFESDRGGAFSGLFSSDGLIFIYGLHDPPSPYLLRSRFPSPFLKRGQNSVNWAIFLIP